MYKIKDDKDIVEELKDGRTAAAIANILDITPVYMQGILNGKYNFKKSIALCLVSLKENMGINNREVKDKLLYYFDEVEE